MNAMHVSGRRWHGPMVLAGLLVLATSTPTLTQAQVDQLNDQGDHARTMGRIAMVTTPVFAIVAGVAFYKGFIKRSSRVTIAPDVSKDGAGAALQIRW